MADSPHSSGDEVPTTSGRTRGATRLRQLILRRNAGERTPVIIDVVTGVASGPNADVFRSYLGVLARDRIFILTPSFDYVSKADRNLIWKDLLITFDMPNVESLRNRCLSAIVERFRGFKKKLTFKYIFGPKSNENPCSKYSAIDEETWRQFVELRSYEAWQEKRSKAQGISAQNKNPHLLSRGGYRKLEEKIMKQKSDSRLPLSTPTVSLYDEVAEMVARQFQQHYEDYGNRPLPSPVAEHVVPPTGRSGKGSCSATGAPGDDMDETRLYEFKVTVDEVVIADAVLAVPTDEFFTVEEAFKSFVAWPRHLVGDVSNPPQIGQEGSPTSKKTHLSEDDPLGALDELAKIISDASMNVHWDSTTFGREAQIPLYLHDQDVKELASGREEINITLIQLWMMYMFDVSNKKGFNVIYGFIDPSMTHERNKFDDIQTYITTYFGMGKEIYFLPYIHGCHWQLLVIFILENTAVLFCSLQKSPPSPLRHVVDW
ncbi:hypothetical protein LR48_Vigan161s000800 [Vigna angularis]|uniref:DUF8039 domain-containing protein n=1 Tax=Phaseolus angularis TaxID=3914 RepID=A0A0L9T6G3_PHAAN|nr:hypothetical protein LR48_Vigan161s000800 [Vigna angularis]